MIGMQYSTNLQAKGVLDVSCFPSSFASESKFKKDGSFEPISVLDTRSPSPSTSTSTLSSSLGGTNSGGGGNTDCTPNLVVGSLKNTLPVHDPTPTVTADNGVAGSPKEEWVAELHGLQSGLELGQEGSEKFSLGLEDWDSILSETAGQDQPLLKWIYDVDDTSCNLKQLLQGGNSNEMDGNGGLGVIDQSFGFDALVTGGSSACSGNVLPTLSSSPLGFSGILNSHTGKFDAAAPSSIVSNSSSDNSQNQNFPPPPPNNLVCVANAFNVVHQQPFQFVTPDHKSANPMPLTSTPQFHNATNVNLWNSLLSCTNQDQPQPKRQNLGFVPAVLSSQIPKVPPLDADPDSILSRKQQQLYLGLGQQLNLISHERKPFLVPKQEVPDGNLIGSPMVVRQLQLQQQQLVYDQLYKATELILAGNFSHAQGILARLNHQLSPAVKPIQRAAFHFKEALQMLLLLPNQATSVLRKTPTPLDGIFKMGAYKMLSEVSPLIQFMNFTSNQALLEALDDAERIHIVDFDIGCGAQWSSFMQELPKKNRGTASLKITGFASASTCHSVEISLMHESLTHFANDLGIKFELEVVNFDSFDPSSYSVSSFRSSQSDTIAVNFPLWSIASRPAILPSLLCFMKQLSPKIMVLLDRGCERFDIPPSHHLLNALQYYEVLLDSIDASNIASDGVGKIEKFLFQPRIESIVFGRLQLANQIPPATNLLMSAGFSTLPLSNFAETQAECVVKRTQVRGFHVEKRQASLALRWQCRDLLSASIWKC